MATNLVNQPTQFPTRKVTAMTLAIAAFEVVWMVWTNAAPNYASPELKAAITPVIPLAIAWFVRDDAVVSVTQNVVATDVIMPEQSDA